MSSDGVKMREIGSEFWQRYPVVSRLDNANEVYLLTGRTALRFILDDICKYRKVRKALLPSYCCESMIIPFVQSGLDVEFYQVNSSGLSFSYANDADIVFLIDFFGYEISENLDIALSEKKKEKIIIYDATHKLNGNKAVENFVDYSFCSYRKWFYCNYAKAVKYHGTFEESDNLPLHKHYLKLRDTAAYEKEKYVAGLPIDKKTYLSSFFEAEQILDADYLGYGGIPVVVDVERIVESRRNNASILISELKNIPQIRLWRDEINSNDVPLFVPILIDEKSRGELRSHLIKEQIYCPIHWPKSSCYGVCSDLYDMELSLVCDQRYDIADMKRVVQAVKNFYMDKR